MLNHNDIEAAVRERIEAVWPGRVVEPFVWAFGPSVPNFRVFRIAPSNGEPWLYVSCGAWQAVTREAARYEFFVLSPQESPSHVETLAMLTNFHASGEYDVDPAKVINIGRPWMDGATCDHLLVSIPYPIGPEREYVNVPNSSMTIRFLWLMPITHDEAAFAHDHGIEALEQKFETAGVAYLDKKRKSVVAP